MHLQLEEFYFQHFSVEYHPGEAPQVQDTVDLARLHFDYDVLYNSDEPGKWAIAMSFYLAPDEDDALPCYEVEAQLFGFFDASEISADAVEYLVRVNGMTMLYGVMRGHVAGATGVFPMGKLVLPSVNMAAVVETVEEAKREEIEEALREEAKAKKKPTGKKKAAAKKKAPAKKKGARKKPSGPSNPLN